MMTKCGAITKAGEACRGNVAPGDDYCPAHDPARDEERRAYGSLGGRIAGRGRPSPISEELRRLQERFEQLAEDVLSGEQDRGDVAVAIQALNGARGCVVGALKAHEQEELEERLEELEAEYAATNPTRIGGF